MTSKVQRTTLVARASAETYDNGVVVVPSFLLESEIVVADTVQSVLIDSGYLTQEEVDSGQGG